MGFSHAFVSHWETGRRAPGPDEVAASANSGSPAPNATASCASPSRRSNPVGSYSAWSACPNTSSRRSTTLAWTRSPNGRPRSSRTVAADSRIRPRPSHAHRCVYAESNPARPAARRQARGRQPRHRARPFTALIAETALREPIGSARIMVEQLTQLAESAQRPNISDPKLRPTLIGWHPGLALLVHHLPFRGFPGSLLLPACTAPASSSPSPSTSASTTARWTSCATRR